MNKTIDVIFFSPTGSTLKIAMAVAKGLAYNINTIDLTMPNGRDSQTTLSGDVVIIAVPVYEECVPHLVLPFFERLDASGQPAVILTVYGNLHRGRALLQLRDIAANCGLRVVAAASFIAEHSFSTDAYPVAAHRPDNDDIAQAISFGEALRHKLGNAQPGLVEVPAEKLSLMARLLPGGSAKVFSKAPKVDLSRCTHCGVCAELCPVVAIDAQSLHIETSRCIRCFTCVKRCAYGARAIEFRLPLIARIFVAQGRDHKENKTYI